MEPNGALLQLHPRPQHPRLRALLGPDRKTAAIDHAALPKTTRHFLMMVLAQPRRANQWLYFARLALTLRGVSRSSRTLARDAMDAWYQSTSDAVADERS